MRDVPLAEIAEYAAEDADIALRLYSPLVAELERVGMLSLARQVEMPLAGVLAEMEEAGVRIDLSGDGRGRKRSHQGSFADGA